MKTLQTQFLKLCILTLGASLPGCSNDSGQVSVLADTTGRYDLTGKSYLGSNGECLKFVDNEVAEFLDREDFRAGSYTWEPENRWMNMYLQVPGSQLPGFETATAQWKRSRSGALEVELVLGGVRYIRMRAAECSTEHETIEEPGGLEPELGANYRLLSERIGGYTEGSSEGAFTARNTQEWREIFLRRMNNFVGTPDIPDFRVDFSKEFIWGYQLVSGHVTSAPRLVSASVQRDQLIITLEQSALGSGCYSLPAMSAPAIVLALPNKFLGRVKLDMRTKIENCDG
jgi:hypothetical protein